MTIPDALVTAAVAELPCMSGGDTACTPKHACAECMSVVRDVLAAAFAKLPECEEAQPLRKSNETIWHDGWRDCLATFARMAES